MTSERWEIVKNLFESALNVSPAERAAFLETQCGGDEEVRREAASLLESLDGSGHFLEEPLMSVKDVVSIPEKQANMAGLRVGAWELVREIGRGGMGTVYLAVRADNEFKKRVAIKLIRGGMETDVLIRRFRNERQILARLEHPNIARLIDGGTTADGFPYFVMEYVEGEPLIKYCEGRSLALRDRLEIFLKACSAVHYAHRRMIIHRDLKPGNILVKEDGTPKLLDFGIAKLLDPDRAGSLAETTLGGFRIATPAYASPEQMRGEAATVRSDVYALGIVLFELITGRRPSIPPGDDSMSTSSGETETSTRLLTGQLRSVVHKAIQFDPKDRYDAVESFSTDVQACLEGAPIPSHAAPTSHDPVPPASPGSVAVLPFRLLGNETSDGYLGLGITDALITKLSNVGRISVRSTSAVMKYAGLSDALAAGRELGVEFVLEGRIQKLAGRVRVTVQLVHIQTDAPVWAGSFDEQFEDLLRVEDSISAQVARALVPQLTGEEREQLARAGTASASAHQAYLRGRWHWNKGTADSLAQALMAFMQAITQDPQYAQAHAGIADYYVQLGLRGGLPPSESFAAAKESAATALRIDPALAEAHASLGFASWAFDRDQAAAAHQFQLAIALNPDYAPAHHWLGLLNSSRGRPEMAVACLERARKLDPDRAVYSGDLAMCYYNARRFGRAIECALNATERVGDDADVYSMLALSYRYDGQLDQALEAARKAADLAGHDTFSRCVLAVVEAARGDRTRARTMLKDLQQESGAPYVSGCMLAMLHLACRQPQKAIDELERSWRDRDWWVLWIGVSPLWDDLRSDSRFRKLLQQQPSDGEPPPSLPIPPARVRASRRPVWAVAAAIALVLLLAVIFAFRSLRPSPAPFPKRTVTRLTTNGMAIRAAVSPDGRFVAYTSGQQGKPVVWVRELDGSAAYHIAGPFAGEIRSLEFIRQGSYVSFEAYLSNEPAKGVLYAAPIAGGAMETVMADVPGPVGVSQDGSKIAYYRADPKSGRDDLMLRNADGSGEHRIASQRYPDRFSWNAGPVWSPDGKQLACAIEHSDPAGFRVVLAIFDTNGSVHTVESPRWQWVGRVAWMESVKGLLVIGQEQNSSFQQIWFVSSGRGDAARLTDDLNDYNSLSAVSDGSALVSVQVQLLTNVYLLRQDDPSHGVQITPASGRYFDLAWTPQGKIVYASDGSGSADLWIMDADGTGRQQLTRDAGRNYSPAVSPDGRAIAFHSNRDGNWNIWWMNLEAREPAQLTRGTRDSNWPQFSKDGTRVLYHHTGLNAMFNIWSVPVTGGSAAQVTRQLTMHPAVSPKDGRIACWYSADIEKPSWKIAIFGPDGGEPLQFLDVAETVMFDTTLRWTPRGDAITYVDGRNGVSNIWIQPLDGKKARALTNFTWGQVYAFDWSADGRLVYSRGMSTSDVVLIRDATKAPRARK